MASPRARGSDVTDDGILEAVVADLRLGTRFVLLSVVSWLAVTLLVSWWRRCVRFRRLELAIAGPKSLPLIGNALNLVGVNKDNTLDTLLGLWGGHYAELSRISLFNQLIVFVTDPEHIQQVLFNRRLMDKPDLYYKALSEVLGQSLVTISGPLWKAHRAAIMPTFHAKVVEGFIDIFSEEAGHFVRRLGGASLGRDTEFIEELGYSAATAVLRTVLPLTKEDEARIELMTRRYMPRAQKIVVIRTFQPWLWPAAVFQCTPMAREVAEIKRYTYAVVEDILERRADEIRAAPADDGGGGHRVDGSGCPQKLKSFVDLMLEAKMALRADFTNSQIIDEMVTVVGGAVETSVTTLAFALKLLSIYPDAQRRLHDELLRVLGDDDGGGRKLASADLPRLEYTERVLKETMRVFPSVPFIGRHVPEDTELDGKLIPAGSVLVVNMYAAHRDPRHHRHPLDFDPDRFLPERAAGRHPCSYVPFSAGPRNCIGRAYAMMHMKTVLATTLLAYEVLPADDGYAHPSHFPLTYDSKLVLIGGVKVRFKQRGRATGVV